MAQLLFAALPVADCVARQQCGPPYITPPTPHKTRIELVTPFLPPPPHTHIVVRYRTWGFRWFYFYLGKHILPSAEIYTFITPTP